MTEFCPDCELKKQMSRITKESLLADALLRGIPVGRETFESRLAICNECYNLEAGIMCNMTGAYCIYTASSENGSCPRNKW